MVRVIHPTLRSLLALALLGSAATGSGAAQGSINPTVAPRAAELADGRKS